MSGTLPASSVFNTRSALLVQVAVISLRYLELAAPSFFCSGMATAMLPASTTMCPMASRRASSPATLTAEGPMSTPRRDWPRSSGTPRMRIWRGGRDWTPPCNRLPELWSFVMSGVDPIERPRERDRLPHVLQAADPGHHALNAHAEARVRNRAVAAQIQIPGESFE